MEKPWTLNDLPPEGHADVGPFIWQLYEDSEAEKQRLGLPNVWLENHRIYRGAVVNKKQKVLANIIFANIQRTVANLTSNSPVAEVVSQDWRPEQDEMGQPIPDDTDKVMSSHLKEWWNTTEQVTSLVDTALNQEIYGVTVEKAILTPKTRKGDVVVVDPFAVVVCPGNWEDLNHSPYVGQAYPERADKIKEMFGIEVAPTGEANRLGEEREENRPQLVNERLGSIPSGSRSVNQSTKATGKPDTVLLVEMWVRDWRKKDVFEEVPDLDPETGEEITRKQKIGDEFAYPGGIRMVTITSDMKVLVDVPNPNINMTLWEDPQTRELVESCFLFDHLPFWHTNSLRDPSSFWGFSACEQVGGLAEQISKILNRMATYLERAMMPTLVLPRDCGVSIHEIDNKPGLVLRPTTASLGSGIRYLEVPSLPSDTVRLYNMLLAAFDRVYQIEDADRGDTPNRIVAASAIVALQERNQDLMRHKIRSLEFIIRQRGRAAISFLQNFGLTSEQVRIDDDTIRDVRGVDLLGRRFNYIVESGSTVSQTSTQIKELAMKLAEMGKIDNRALLEALQFPGWRQVVERMAESGTQLEQAAQIFVAAGVPMEQVQELLAFAKQPQGGPGAQGRA